MAQSTTSITLPDVNVIANAPSASVPETPGAGAPSSDTAAYAPRAIDVTIGLAGSSSVKLTGLRVEVVVENVTLPSTGIATARIYGMTLDRMNALSKAGQVYEAQNNTILIEAGDQGAKLTPIFRGIVIEAYPDFRSQPEVSFYIMATPTSIAQLKPVSPTSFSGGTQASVAFEKIAQAAGWKFENNAVNVAFQSPYFSGTAWTQLLSCVRAAGCFAYFDSMQNTVAVWPKLGNRTGAAVTISPESGMKGYPSFQAKIVTVPTLFDPRPRIGQLINVKSQLKAANGQFTCVNVTHDLASQTPDGPWETIVSGSPKT